MKAEKILKNIDTINLISCCNENHNDNSIICTTLGVAIKAYPLVIFKEGWTYCYLKCTKAYYTYNHELIKYEKLKTQIELNISANSDSKNSIVDTVYYVETTQLFTIWNKDFHKICQEQNIEYWELNGDHIAKNKQQEIMSKLTENMKFFAPKISYFHVDIDKENKPKFIPIFCDKEILKHEKELLKAKIWPYNNYAEKAEKKKY